MFLSVFILFFTIVFSCIFPDVIRLSCIDGLKLYVFNVFPVLFINFILSYSIKSTLKVKNYSPLVIIIAAVVSGFPNGAYICSNAAKNDEYNETRYKKIAGIVNIPGPIFLLTYVYRNYLSNEFNLFVYLISIYLPVIIIVFWIFRGHMIKTIEKKKCDKMNITEVFCESVNYASEKSLMIGGYIILFYILDMMINRLGKLEVIKYITIPLLELTNGLSFVKSIDINNMIKCVIFNSLCAFGGVCVMLQTKNLCPDLDIKKYIHQKLCMMLLTALITGLLVYV